MTDTHDHILDNPVWHALNTVQSRMAIGTNMIRKFPADMLRMVGCENPGIANLTNIEPWLVPDEKVFIVGVLPRLPANWSIKVELDCVQMIYLKPGYRPETVSQKIVELTAADNDEIVNLVNLVQPGYFHKNTRLLGSYFGIKINDKLVALAGERLRMTGFTEISAVVTHPEFTGRSFAQQLVSHVVRKNLDEGAIPFLHFVSSNIRARKIYELLGIY